MPSDLAKVEKLWKTKGLSLFDFQREGCLKMLKWRENGHGGINADEMGLGKTCQSIAVMLTLLEKGEGPFLVMAPLSVAPHWFTEVERFGCGKLEPYFYKGGIHLRHIIHKTEMMRNSVIVVPHHTFRRDHNIIEQWASKQKCAFTSVFVDEAQYVKNYNALISKRLRMSTSNCTMYMLTGTPIQNNLMELYSLLCFANPTTFSDSNEDFEEFQEVHSATANYGALKELLQAYMIRRTKSEVYTDIPPLEEVLIYHGLSSLQKGVYMDFITKNGKDMCARYGCANSTVSRITQLRKTVSHPYLIKGVEPKPFTEGEHIVTSSAKFEMLDSILKFLQKGNHKVLIFSQWIYTQVMVEDYLNLRDFPYVLINGGIALADRVDAIDRFQRRKESGNQSDDPFIFLVTTRAGGLGLTLTEADTVIFTDSDWNPQMDEQAMARTHRIGQKKPVRVIRLIGRYTIEQVMFARAQKKLELSNDIMEDREGRKLYDSVFLLDRVVSAANKIDDTSALTDAELEKLIGTTDDKTGCWVQRDINKERKVVDAEDVEVNDYLVYQGTSYHQPEEKEDLIMHSRKRRTKAYVDFSDVEDDE